MIIGRVVGNVVSTRKYEGLQGYKLLVIKQKFTEDIFVAADVIGAGIGELVLVTMGSNTQFALDKQSPVDALVVGIIDSDLVIETQE